MNPDLILTSLLALAALILVIGGPILILRRASRLNAAQDAEARAFEQEILIASRRPEATEGAEAAPAVPETRRPVGQALPAYGTPTVPPEPAPAEPVPPAGSPPPASTSPTSTSPAGAPISDGLSPFVRGVIDKLEVAGRFKSVEGPLRCTNPELKGTLISLKGDKRLGIIEEGFDPDDPALQALLRHMDGLIMAGAGGEALVFKRFQDFLSDIIAL